MGPAKFLIEAQAIAGYSLSLAFVLHVGSHQARKDARFRTRTSIKVVLLGVLVLAISIPAIWGGHLRWDFGIFAFLWLPILAVGLVAKRHPLEILERDSRTEFKISRIGRIELIFFLGLAVALAMVLSAVVHP